MHARVVLVDTLELRNVEAAAQHLEHFDLAPHGAQVRRHLGGVGGGVGALGDGLAGKDAAGLAVRDGGDDTVGAAAHLMVYAVELCEVPLVAEVSLACRGAAVRSERTGPWDRFRWLRAAGRQA